MYKRALLAILITGIFNANIVYTQDSFTIGILKYRGGDWYSCINAVKNFLKYLHSNTPIKPILEPVVIDPSKSEIFQYPFIVLNGHGQILLNELEKNMLKRYLENGGFLLANDDYGMDKHFRKLMSDIFPGNRLISLPVSHEIFKSYYIFHSIPKIHKHDGKKPEILALYIQNRIAVLYVYESDVMDGWEPEGVHPLDHEKRKKALQLGINIVYYTLTG